VRHSLADLNVSAAGRHARRLGGYSLVELLVAMLIALFLLAGLLTIVQSMRNTFSAQSSLAQLEDNERLAMIMMTNVIQTAGYFPNPMVNTIDTALPAATWPDPDGTGTFQLGQPIAGDSGSSEPTGSPGDTDTISVRFQTASGDTNLNCIGGTNTSGANLTYTNTFSIDGDGNLDCTVSINGAQQAPVQLAAGVQNLQIWYGVRTNPAVSDNNVDTYLTAAQMNANPGDWPNVTAVKIRLTFTNPLAASNPSQPTTNYIECVVGVMARTGVIT
jgi:type IV pilus assembly protein PilW